MPGLSLIVSDKNAKHSSKSLKIVVRPKGSSDAQAAEELTKWLENIWGDRTVSAGVADLRLDTSGKRTTTPIAGTHTMPELKESKLTHRHLRRDLPQQMCERILLTETSCAGELKHESQANVAVTGRRGFILEAWGRWQSLEQLSDLIDDEATESPPLVAEGVTHPATNKVCRMTIFKNCSSPSSRIMIENYDGPCQPEHRKFTRHLPRVLDPDPESSFSRDKFVERSLQQLRLINAEFNEDVHGKMHVIISYGTLYITECNLQEIQESEFDDMLAINQRKRNPVYSHGQAMGGTRGWTGKDHSFVPQSKSYCGTSFIHTGNPHIDKSLLQAFLWNKGFELAGTKVEYLLSLVNPKDRRRSDVLVLNKNFDPKKMYVNKQENKWLFVNIVSASKDSATYRPYDCRFHILSTISFTGPESVDEHADVFSDIIANHRDILLRTDNEVYGVRKKFMSRVPYARKRHVEVYQLADNQHGAITDAFLEGMDIIINYGTEYMRPSLPTGAFQKIDCNRVEITAEPELPDIRDEDIMRTFFTECWQFMEELGSVLE